MLPTNQVCVTMLYWLVVDVCCKWGVEGYSFFRGIKEGKPSVLQFDYLVDTWVGKERWGWIQSFLPTYAWIIFKNYFQFSVHNQLGRRGGIVAL